MCFVRLSKKFKTLNLVGLDWKYWTAFLGGWSGWSFWGLSMGALDNGHFNAELENGVNAGGCIELGLEGEQEYPAIEDAVRVLLHGLGEDINREGIRKTPLRVAKALKEGTRGDPALPVVFSLVSCNC